MGYSPSDRRLAGSGVKGDRRRACDDVRAGFITRRYITDVWALPGSGYLKIARSEIGRIRAAGAPSQEKKG